jgi:uncharacterized membrane protein YkoI
MRQVISTLVLAGLMLATFCMTIDAQSKKIGMKRAQQIASSHAKGLRLKAKELEHENGKWIYSFEFNNKDGSIREVNVNAYTGKIVAIEREGTKKEASEQRMEKKKN